MRTPASDLFIRNHFASPAPDPAAWRIQITGAVGLPASLSLDELRSKMQDVAVTVMECAGNGVGAGGVGCVEFHGTRLGKVLSECSPSKDALFVRLVGADRGVEPDSGADSITYSRVVPFSKAAGGLLALELNGAPLSADHGAPVRFVLPGSYGMNSVKWLRRVEILEQPVADFFTDQRFRRVSDNSPGDGLGDIRVKSIVVHPKANAAMRGASTRAGGYAWVGNSEIARVEVSVDSGSWQTARLLGTSSSGAWVPWAYETARIRPGVHTIAVRAFAVSGESQPATRDRHREDGYELNHYHQVPFMLRP